MTIRMQETMSIKASHGSKEATSRESRKRVIKVEPAIAIMFVEKAFLNSRFAINISMLFVPAVSCAGKFTVSFNLINKFEHK